MAVAYSSYGSKHCTHNKAPGCYTFIASHRWSLFPGWSRKACFTSIPLKIRKNNMQSIKSPGWKFKKKKNSFSSYLLSWNARLSHRPNETNQALEYRDTMLEGWICRYLGTKEASVPGVSLFLLWIQYFLRLQALPAGTKCFLSFFFCFFGTSNFLLVFFKGKVQYLRIFLYLPLVPLPQLSQEILFCQFYPKKSRYSAE